MTGIMIKLKTHRVPSQTIVGTTMIIMRINDIKLHQFLVSMMIINSRIPIDFFPAKQSESEKEYATMGGGIESPSNNVYQQLAWNLRVSCFDAADLADKDYHGGVDGFDPLTITIIKNCGYSTISFIQLHCKTLDGWVHTWTLQRGPLVERIVEKALPLFKKLDGITAAELVYFYDVFQKTASVYLQPFMPFDAISIKLGFEGLCPPGIGIYRYADVATALMDVLPRVMPELISCLGMIIAAV